MYTSKKLKLGGDYPCFDCGTNENIVWFTDNIFWNQVMGKNKIKILCVHCFVLRAEKKFKITGWKLLPEINNIIKKV